MNPFIHYRERLSSYEMARARGWSDARFVTLVEALDEAVAGIHGHGFAVTPFGSADALGAEMGLGTGRLWIKDDTGNVAGSHKARHLFGVALHHAVSGDTDGELAIASCGNAAIAAAVVARAARRPLTVFIPTWADRAVVSRLEALAARIVICERREDEHGDPTYLRLAEAVVGGAVPFSCQASMTPTTLDGGRTIGWELADQLAQHGIDGVVRLYVQVGGGALASAAWMGLSEGIQRGATGLQVVLHPVQTTACAPLARAWTLLARAGNDPGQRMAAARDHPQQFMWAWEEVGMSAASGILDDVTYDWLHIVQAMLESGGWPVTAGESEVIEAHRLVHASTSVDADATGSAGLAGVIHDLALGRIGSHEHVVVLATGVTRRALP